MKLRHLAKAIIFFTLPLTISACSEKNWPELFPLNEQCLTDTDQDGYGMSVEGIFAQKTTNGTCYALTIDSVGSGCRAYVDVYQNGVILTSYESPSTGSVRYDECSVDGYLQIGWTQDDIFDNGGCMLTIEDENGALLYRSTEYERSYIPQGGTDPNDGDASVY